MNNIKNTISVGFTGDFAFSAYFDGCYKNEDVISKEIQDFFNSNDANVLNFESPVTQCKVTKKKRLAHRTDPEALYYIKDKIRNPIFSLANNHMMDFSYIGLTDTLDNLENSDIPYIGAGRNLKDAARYTVLENGDFKVGIFAVQFYKPKTATEKLCGTLHEGKAEEINNIISELKNKVDKIILVYHGGDEFLHTPMPYLRKQLKKYLKMGCDAVVAHHPHTVQGYEKVDNKYIFYSLGNFMFDTDYQRIQDDSDQGVVLKLIISPNGFEFEHLPIRIDRENHKVLKRDKDEYFVDITKDYGRMWKKEAARKREAMRKRAIILSETQKSRESSKNLYRIVKKTVKKFIQKDNYRKLVRMYGSAMSKLYK